MTSVEYELRRADIFDGCMDEICEHESAGCYGDAENARKRMRRELAQLKKEYEEGAS